uniref:NADH-ubiquinone oxidoreductase chain 4 n=1 Tax=Cryphonectria parasitica TaxID=5116 RepID=A0A191MXC0_CRYPA|nr:NADH dehydrogenase subunit 4 [Cryphonectria parasitica]
MKPSLGGVVVSSFGLSNITLANGGTNFNGKDSGVVVGEYNNNIYYKLVALGTSVINLIISLIIYISFDFSSNQFQFVQEHYDISYFDIYLGIDGLSIYFVLLTTIIMPIALLSNWNSITENIKSYLIIILLLETLLLAVFLVLDILLFYIFFESILVPLFILIGIFGSKNKVRASFYLFLYTLFSSLFMLLAILVISSIAGTTDFEAVFKVNLDYSLQLILFAGLFFAIAVKTPLYGLNSWLLKAHTESPLGGSVILAAIVLKLALYGIFRLLLPILPDACLVFTPLVFILCAITVIYASFSTLRTTDIKEIIAYSSVSHAAVYLLGVFSNTVQGIEGAILLGLGHGFVSSGLFIIVGGVLYDRSGTRDIAFYRGMAQLMPLFSILFFILILANCGTPLTLNFVGEFLCLYGGFERLPIIGALACSSIVLSAAYSVYLFNRIAFGGSFSMYFVESILDLTKREFFILFILTLFTVLLGIYPSFILDGLHYNVSSLIYSTSEYSLLAAAPVFIFKGARGKSTFAVNNKVKGKAIYAPSSSLDKLRGVLNLTPEFITGFSEKKGCFALRVFQPSNKQERTDFSVESVGKYYASLSFRIGIHIKDIALLEGIHKYFRGVGVINKIGKSMIHFQVSDIKELFLIIDHFDNYPLLSYKAVDYNLFKQAYYLILAKEHLTSEGLIKLL